MNIYRNKNNGRLYLVTHLIKDIRHLNNNGFAGIYAYSYNWDGEIISMMSKNKDECVEFVKCEFKKVAEL